MSKSKPKAWTALVVAVSVTGVVALTHTAALGAALRRPREALAAAVYMRMANAYGAGLRAPADLETAPVLPSSASPAQ